MVYPCVRVDRHPVEVDHDFVAHVDLDANTPRVQLHCLRALNMVCLPLESLRVGGHREDRGVNEVEVHLSCDEERVGRPHDGGGCESSGDIHLVTVHYDHSYSLQNDAEVDMHLYRHHNLRRGDDRDGPPRVDNHRSTHAHLHKCLSKLAYSYCDYYHVYNDLHYLLCHYLTSHRIDPVVTWNAFLHRYGLFVPLYLRRSSL